VKVLAVLGSARRKGNTETLMNEAIKAIGDRAKVTLRVVEEMTVHGCQGCKGCRIPGADGCIFMDDMQTLYTEMKEADALILGSPVYYGEVTGQMKCFMDRWYALRDGERRLRMASGKKVLFILTQGAPTNDRYHAALDRLTKVLTSYDMVPDIVVAAGVEKKGDARKRPELLEAARKGGEWLVSASDTAAAAAAPAA